MKLVLFFLVYGTLSFAKGTQYLCHFYDLDHDLSASGTYDLYSGNRPLRLTLSEATLHIQYSSKDGDHGLLVDLSKSTGGSFSTHLLFYKPLPEFYLTGGADRNEQYKVHCELK